MSDKTDVIITTGAVELKSLEDTKYLWYGTPAEDRELQFQKAYMIERTNWNEGIRNCDYRVHEREFTDLSFANGTTIQKSPEGYEIREHEDGTRFLYRLSYIPTFDSDDRDWDGYSRTVVYRDSEGVNIIHCRHGYLIPRIECYTGLMKSTPAFDECLKLLDGKNPPGEDQPVSEDKPVLTEEASAVNEQAELIEKKGSFFSFRKRK